MVTSDYSYSVHGDRVIVTGGAGFLGSHFCGRLVREGAEVLSDDNFTSRDASITHLTENPLFALRHDVTFRLYVEVDAIFNFACPASPIHYQLGPIATTWARDRPLGQIHPLPEKAL
jgi:UDP-glucuronate decarboxylase